ncbi:hypothetical protein CVT26_012945 [Gymnopilus dilepis]|uniref:Pentatricopeptide repeat-containing protein-mitochondrial domain-containing protein n=1 Tax=Gymnopilus dilepis TaxID=231916 RepID=A0A409Y474_9AGAR|nr:hypothetical protein CVT26_012945 [Gymnopilus dilepis]
MNVVGRALRRSALNSASFRLPVQPSVYVASVSSLRCANRLFSQAPNPQESSKVTELIEALKSSNDLPSIHSSCSALRAEITKAHGFSPVSPSSSDVDRLLAVLHLLVVSGRTHDWERFEQIFRDLRPALGLKPSKSLYSSILLRLAEEGHHHRALDLLLKMPQLPGQMTPELSQIHLVLKTSSQTADLQFLKECVANMRRMGQRPTPKTFVILFNACGTIAARREALPSLDEVSSLVQEYVRQGLTFDSIVAQAIYNIYAEAADFDRAQEALTFYETAVSSSKDEASNTAPSQIVRDAARSMLRKSRTYADIKSVSQRLGVPCNVEHYSIVIGNCIRAGNKSEAFNVYAKSKEDGIIPDAALVAPLLRVLNEERSSDVVDKAISIYRDLADAQRSSPSQAVKDLDHHSAGPDAAIYDRLFRILLSSPDSNKCLPIVESLIEEMAARGLPTDTNSVATAQILSEMRRTRDFSQAVDVYHERRGCLNEHGYHAVLQEYCRISFVGDLEVPLITQYFSIVNDMRLRQIPITSKVYTIILYYIGIMATKIRESRMDSSLSRHVLERLISTTRRVHDYLTLDASISPDAILWNQLMNTYQRMGCLGDACRLWEVMYLSGRFDQVSVNIILDACGHGGRLDIASSVLSKLLRTGFALDLHNWNTWLESLCRNGKIDLAVQVVLHKMKENGMRPNLHSIRVIYNFAKRHRVDPSTLRPVQEYYPALWAQLMRETRNP